MVFENKEFKLNVLSVFESGRVMTAGFCSSTFILTAGLFIDNYFLHIWGGNRTCWANFCDL